MKNSYNSFIFVIKCDIWTSKYHCMKAYYYLLFLATLLAFGCHNSKQLAEAPLAVTLDEVVVRPQEIRKYNASRTRKMDLIHTNLEVSFDFEKQYLYGKASLTLRPYFYPTNTLELDAKGFEIKSIRIENQSLIYTYDSLMLTISLNKEYQKEDTFQVVIEYIAKPNERTAGGSKAIHSDKGLYFINPLGNEKKPQQIWTQGETEANSCWFPTIDSPNEKMTQEISITVPQKFQTLSNGTLVFQTENANGTRTDYWKQEKPHAPYLLFKVIKLRLSLGKIQSSCSKGLCFRCNGKYFLCNSRRVFATNRQRIA